MKKIKSSYEPFESEEEKHAFWTVVIIGMVIIFGMILLFGLL